MALLSKQPCHSSNMTTSKPEALSLARKLCRSLLSAPDANARMRQILSALAHGEGWTARERAAIDEFVRWLQSRPRPAQLKEGGEALLKQL